MAQVAPGAVAVQGVLLQIGNGGSPETFTSIAYIASYSRSGQTRKVDISNVSDSWMRIIPTLLEAGTITMEIFWKMHEPTHSNNAAGLRGLWINKTLTDFQIVFPGGNGTDAFQAYVTKFSDNGKVADVFRAQIDISIDDAPSYV